MQSGPSSSTALDYARIPPRLKDLLRRETCMAASHRQLEEAIVEFQTQHHETKATRPPFLFLHRKAVREEFNQRMTETRQTLEALEKGRAKLHELLPRLHGWIVEEIEGYMLTDHPAYLAGLAKQRFPADWNRLCERAAAHVAQFSASSTQLQQAVLALHAEQRLAGQLHIMDLVKTARVHGAKVDADIAFINQIAQLQAAAGTQRALSEVPAPRCETNVARVAMIDDINSRELLSRFVTKFLQIGPGMIEQCRQQAQFSATRSVGDLPSYIEAVWDALRAHALNEFNPSLMERMLIETERMLERHDQG